MTHKSLLDLAIAAVIEEVEKATHKFPTWPVDPIHALAVLGEEFGELTKATVQAIYEPHKNEPGEVRKEAVQTAAMAIRFILSLDDYELKPCSQLVQNATFAAAVLDEMEKKNV